MIQISFSILLLVTLCHCEPPVTSYGTPVNNYNVPSTYGVPPAPTNNFGSGGGPYPPSGVPAGNFGGNNYAGGSYAGGNHAGGSYAGGSYAGGSYGNGHDHGHGANDHAEPKSYEFGYAVKDDYSGNDYKRRETSDGNQVNGEYRVQLPDGRTQIVTYYADWQSGFHADVRYEGTANYPDTYKVAGFSGNQGYGGNQGGYNGYQGGYNQNANYAAPSNQYGAPFNGNTPSNQYGTPYQGDLGSAKSSVMIQDFSGPGTPYNVGGNGHHMDVSITHDNGYDSYANAGNFGNRQKPSTAYGAP